MHIVYIDDLGVENTKEHLELDGHNVKDFISADEAYKYILENQWGIDLVLIDEVLNKTTSKNYTSGIALGKAITSFSRTIPMVMVTGGDFKIETSIRAFTQAGFSHFIKKTPFEKEPEKYLNEIINLDAVQTKWDLRATSKKILLDTYFNNITDDKRAELSDLCDNASTNWTNQEITIQEGVKVQIATLLSDVTISENSIRNNVRDYLDKTDPEFNMNGWNQNNWIRVYWNNYILRKDYQKWLEYINVEATSILTEIRHLVQNVSPSATNFCKIKVQNVKQYIGNNFSYDSSVFNVFIQKMICRRVFIGFSECILDYHGSDYDYNVLCNLLRHGHLEKVGNLEGDYIRTKLGLSKVGDKIIIEEQTTFREEREWLENYKQMGEEIRGVLDSFPQENLKDLHDWRQFSARQKLQSNPIKLPNISAKTTSLLTKEYS